MKFKLFGLRMNGLSVGYILLALVLFIVRSDFLFNGTNTYKWHGPEVIIPSQSGIVSVSSPDAPFTIQLRSDSSFGTIRKEVGTANDATYQFSETVSYGDPWADQTIKHFSEPVQFPSGATTFYTFPGQEFRILGDAQMRVTNVENMPSRTLMLWRFLTISLILGFLYRAYLEHKSQVLLEKYSRPV